MMWSMWRADEVDADGERRWWRSWSMTIVIPGAVVIVLLLIVLISVLLIDWGIVELN